MKMKECANNLLGLIDDLKYSLERNHPNNLYVVTKCDTARKLINSIVAADSKLRCEYKKLKKKNKKLKIKYKELKRLVNKLEVKNVKQIDLGSGRV